MPQQRIAARKPLNRKRKQQLRFGLTGLAAVLLVVALAVFVLDSDEQADANADQTTAAVVGDGNGPQLAVDQTDIAYGDVAYGHPVEATYRLTNVGDEVLVLDEPSIKTLEGC